MINAETLRSGRRALPRQRRRYPAPSPVNATGNRRLHRCWAAEGESIHGFPRGKGEGTEAGAGSRPGPRASIHPSSTAISASRGTPRGFPRDPTAIAIPIEGLQPFLRDFEFFGIEVAVFVGVQTNSKGFRPLTASATGGLISGPPTPPGGRPPPGGRISGPPPPPLAEDDQPLRRGDDLHPLPAASTDAITSLVLPSRPLSNSRREKVPSSRCVTAPWRGSPSTE